MIKIIYCKVGKCPKDKKRPICCTYCVKKKVCSSACKKVNSHCSLSYKSSEIKKEMAYSHQNKIKYPSSIITEESEAVQ